MMIQEALKMIKTISEFNDIDLTDREIRIILSEAMDRDINHVITNKNDILTNRQESYLKYIINEFICYSKPIEKITKKAYFYGLELYVDEHVLSPRQDTEILAEQVLKYAKGNHTGGIKMLDIGTGSGCLSIAVAVNLENCTITASDISDEALAVADRNIEKYMLNDRIRLKKSDLFNGISDVKYDIIMSNPPYISDADYEELDAKVKDHDPYIALKGGWDGLDMIRSILSQAHRFLCADGALFLEIGFDQAFKVKELMKERYKDIRIYTDHGGNDRVIFGKLSDLGENI